MKSFGEDSIEFNPKVPWPVHDFTMYQIFFHSELGSSLSWSLFTLWKIPYLLFGYSWLPIDKIEKSPEFACF